MSSKSTKRKRIAPTVTQKLELIRKIREKSQLLRVSEEYDVAKQAMSDIRKSKGKKLYISLRTVISFYFY